MADPSPATYTLFDMEQAVRAELGDTSPLFYTFDDVVRWLNFGVQDFCTKTKISTTVSRTLLHANRRIYPLPRDFMRMEWVVYNDSDTLLPYTLNELRAWVGARSLTLTGKPELYYLRGTRDDPMCAWLWKVPGVGEEEQPIEFWYEAKPDKMAAPADPFPLSSEWAYAVIVFAIQRGHMKNRQHPDADRYSKMYEAYVDEASQRIRRPWVDRPRVALPAEAYDEGRRTW